MITDTVYALAGAMTRTGIALSTIAAAVVVVRHSCRLCMGAGPSMRAAAPLLTAWFVLAVRVTVVTVAAGGR